ANPGEGQLRSRRKPQGRRQRQPERTQAIINGRHVETPRRLTDYARCPFPASRRSPSAFIHADRPTFKRSSRILVQNPWRRNSAAIRARDKGSRVGNAAK